MKRLSCLKKKHFYKKFTLSPFKPTAPGVPGGPLRPSAPCKDTNFN